jgi:hypothetical protein
MTQPNRIHKIVALLCKIVIPTSSYWSDTIKMFFTWAAATRISCGSISTENEMQNIKEMWGKRGRPGGGQSCCLYDDLTKSYWRSWGGNIVVQPRSHGSAWVVLLPEDWKGGQPWAAAEGREEGTCSTIHELTCSCIMIFLFLCACTCQLCKQNC